MTIGNQEITREDMPSYEVGGNYKDRMYQVYQDLYARRNQPIQNAQPMEQPTQGFGQQTTMSQ